MIKFDTKLITIHWENPFYIWKTYARKFFKFPHVKIGFANRNWHSKPCSWLLDVYAYDMAWKSKYGELEHENDPYIEITLLTIITIHVAITAPIESRDNLDLCYWEAMLTMMDNVNANTSEKKLTDDEALWKAYNDNIWSDCNGKVNHTLYPFLKPLGKHIIDVKLASKHQFVHITGDLD